MLKIKITSYNDASSRYDVLVDDDFNGTTYSANIDEFLLPYIAPEILTADSDDPHALISKTFTLKRKLCADFGA